VVVGDAEAVIDEGGRRVAASLAAALAERGRAHWCVTGGSTAAGIYRALADVDGPLRAQVAWGDVHAWWGDDRYVPRDHPLSNVKPFDDILLGRVGEDVGGGGPADGPAGVPIPSEHIHPFRTGEAIGRSRDAAWCAAALGDELRGAELPVVGGWPSFDLLVLGVGGDGHILSVFPGSTALGAMDLAIAVPAPTHIEPRVQRVTLNPAVVAAAQRVLVLVTGSAKAPVIGEIFGPDRDPGRWPAQLALRDGATWILDEAAAARLAP
jgi:6-phosphogluconolactonase